MNKLLIAAASLGISMSAAHACDYMRSTSAQNTSVDPAVVASVTPDKAVPMSVPDRTNAQGQSDASQAPLVETAK